MGMGRRAQIMRNLLRASGNLDKYLAHLQICHQLVGYPVHKIGADLEGLAKIALKLQELTDQMYERM